jgi:LuxR family glucitol operon transcriptional activator
MLPRDFLIQMAHKHELSQPQEAVFLLRFADGQSYQEIAAQLNTSPAACLKRMGEVYNKFKVSGGHRGKENRLRIALLNQLQPIPEHDSSSLSGIAKLPLETQTSSSEHSPSLTGMRAEPNPKLTSPASFILNNLPNRDYTAFIGRHQEMARLMDLLSPDHAAHLITIDGIGGVGKTTLALEAAYRCLRASTQSDPSVPHFDAIIFTSAKPNHLTAFGLLPRLRQERTLRDIFRAIAQTLQRTEINHVPPGEQFELIQECLSAQRTLLIVDNLETIEDKQTVLSFLYDLPPIVKVILTTREQALFVPIRLESLIESDGLRLIHHEAREKKITLKEGDAQILYKCTSGIPAAIIYTIGQLVAGYWLPDVIAKVNDAKGDIARFCFEGAVQPLRGQPAHLILMALALFPKPVLREAIAHIALPVPDPMATADGLARLQQLSLVQQYQSRYNLLPLTCEYALAELSSHPTLNQDIRQRWVNWYLSFLDAYGETDWKEWHLEYGHLVAEWENLQAALEWCITKDRYEDMRSLWQRMKGYAHVRGYWDDRLDWTEWLIQAAEGRGDWPTAVEAMADRGWTLTLMGQPQSLQEASTVLQRAWELKNNQNPLCQLDIATSLVVLCIRQQQFPQAQRWLAEEKWLLEQVTLSEREQQRQHIHIGYYEAEICFRLKDYAQAKTLYQQVLAQAQVAGWQRAVVAIQNWLAEIALQQGDLEAAQQLLKQGLPVAERHQDKRSIAFHKRSLAWLEKRRGNLTQAKQWATEALEGFESLRMIPEAQETSDLLVAIQTTSAASQR